MRVTLNDLMPNRVRCPECGRVFDLMDEDDAGEWYYGHDCETPPTIDEPGFVPFDRPPNMYRGRDGWHCSDCGKGVILFDDDEHFCDVTGTSSEINQDYEYEDDE